MIFATDLDNTIIFSKKHIESAQNSFNIRLIEKKGSEEISYMTNKSVELINKISRLCTFIPITTRTLEQYRRISIFQEEIKPKYAVCDNGGTILIDGKIDTTWEEFICENIQNLKVSAKDIWNIFSEIIENSWVISYKFSDGLFFSVVVNTEYIPLQKLYVFMNQAKEYKWTVYLQGRKIYIIPEFINKWNAINYLNESLKDTTIISAGDSLLDYCLLENSTVAYVPSHSELKEYIHNNSCTSKINFTTQNGIISGEEILLRVYDFLT